MREYVHAIICEWLDPHEGDLNLVVREQSASDYRTVFPYVLEAVKKDVLSLISEGRTVVVLLYWTPVAPAELGKQMNT